MADAGAISVAHETQAQRLLVKVCAWCERVHLGERWVEPGEAIVARRTFELPEPPSVAHGICGECVRRVAAARRPTATSA